MALSSEQSIPPTSTPSLTRAQLSIIAGLIVVYAALSYYSSSVPEAKGLAAGLSIGPVVLIAVALVWRWSGAPLALLVAAGAGAVLYRYWGAIEQNYTWADLAEQCGAYVLIASSFARTLFGGRVPLCTQLAAKLHGELAPREIAYTRHATMVWTLFYLGLAAAIALLFFTASEHAWSMFVNFATYGLIALACLVDAAIRHRVLPRRTTGGLMSLLRQALIG